MIELLVMVAVAVSGAAGVHRLLTYYGVDEITKRRIRDARSWRIADLPEDTAGRVVGRVHARGGTLTSPLTGRTCVYYLATIDEHDGENHRRLVTDTRGVPFVIDDGSGRAVVDPTGAQVTLELDLQLETGAYDDETEPQTRLLAQRHYRRAMLSATAILEFREATIELGETIALLGAGRREADPEAEAGEVRGPLPTRLRLMSSRRHPLLLSDRAEAVGGGDDPRPP